jgi:hypothetical protein
VRNTIRSSRRLESQVPTRTMVGAHHKSRRALTGRVSSVTTLATGGISVYGHGSDATLRRPPPAHNLIGSTNSLDCRSSRSRGKGGEPVETLHRFGGTCRTAGLRTPRSYRSLPCNQARPDRLESCSRFGLLTGSGSTTPPVGGDESYKLFSVTGFRGQRRGSRK